MHVEFKEKVRLIMSKRWELDEVFERFSDQFDHYLSRLAQRQRQGISNESAWPATDIFETREAFWITMELPGVTKDDVSLNLVGDDLVIEGNKKISLREEECNYHQIERTYGHFKRVVRLPETIAFDTISASYENGVLSVVVPKSDMSSSHKRIRIG
jgi:HSP20 family protein